MSDIEAFRIVKRRPWSSWVVAALAPSADAPHIIEVRLPFLSVL